MLDVKRVGLIGDPIGHSLSPGMQQAAFDALGVPARYELWPTAAAELAERVAGLRVEGVLGANVTVPHKAAVIGLVDEVSATARRAGAVNTIVNRDRRLSGDNTDVHGFAASLAGVCPDTAERSALVLGAGGAARAVVLALDGLGVSQIAVANRDAGRAERLSNDLAPTPIRVVAGERALASEIAGARLLINATSLGRRPGETPLPPGTLASLPADALVVDLTYRETDLLAAARERGLATLDGLAMLVHQGARSLELWTGRSAPVGLMMEAARRARDERSGGG